MTALKQKTGKKGDWFGSPTPCLCQESNQIIFVTKLLSLRPKKLVTVAGARSYPTLLKRDPVYPGITYNQIEYILRTIIK